MAASPSSSTQPAASPFCPVAQLCASPSPTPTHTPSPRPTTSPTRSPSPRPTAPGGGHGGGSTPNPVPPPPAAVGSNPPPPSSGNLVGQSSGPPTPPAVPGSRLDIQTDPSNPRPGTDVLVTVTLSGSSGADRYAVPNAPVTLELVEKPDDRATLSATNLTTDVTGSATARLTLSPTRGRHVVRATSGGLRNQALVDTLAGSTASSGRARHDGNLVQTRVAPVVDPMYLVAAAVLILVVSFLWPYRRRVFGRRRAAVPASALATALVTAPPPSVEPEPASPAVADSIPAAPVPPSRPARANKPAAARKTRAATPTPAAGPKVSSARRSPRAPRSAAPGG